VSESAGRSELRAQFVARYPFPIDRFQTESFEALDRGEHVVVAVPTGSGKTVVAEYGIAAARQDGMRAFYTAPVKALSNQKYRDLVAIHGEELVGLLTGDNSINGDAPIVVMTTEVLRNMIYGRSRLLDDLGLVVLDEVHFLQDSYRGPVWEEVMIHLPHHVRLVCLSATVSNVDELAAWITTVRGPTASIVERRRPVRLDNEYLVADRTNDRLRMLPVLVDGHVNRDAVALDESAVRGRPGRGGDGRNRSKHRGDRNTNQGSGRKVLAPPSRVETVELLERRRLGYQQFVTQLECGIAAHHAGMVPPMKEVVEACFVEGLVKVVFATETLAVGINMPARTVVIEKLTKFTGEHHERLTPGEYTQLTGRAGRRGIDDLGTAVVLWSPWVRFDEVAELAGSSSFHLRSAFRPTYNMAANLVRTYSSSEAHHLLNLSFAQYQADRDVVRLEARLERRRAAATELRSKAHSEFGDIDEYRHLRDQERDERAAGRSARRDAVDDALAALRPGVVIHVVKGTYKGPAAVIASASRKNGLRLTLITRSAKALYLTAEDFDEPPRSIGSISMPSTYAPNRKEYRNDIARRLRGLRAHPSPSTKRRRQRNDALADNHPVARDPDLRTKLHAAAQADRIEREIADLDRRVSGKNTSLANEFDRVLDVLTTYGYLDRSGWSLTEAGEILARTFHESDLLVAEIIRSGVLDGLSASDLAALVSTVVYEHRSSDAPPAPWFSSNELRARWRRLEAISEDLRAAERSVGLAEHRAPDPTFAAIAYAWVAGEGFAEVVADDELTGGDFVRTTKQLIDLLRQLAIVVPDPATRRAAAQAAEAAFRGVVADSAAPTPTRA